MTLLALIVVIQIVNVVIEGRPLEPLMLTLAVVFFVTMALIALHDVILGGPIDGNRLVGAICVYLLLAIAWALVFAVVDVLTAEPMFSNIELRGGAVDFAALLYYSLVTLTTLGYGDIAPLSPLARMLAALEATFGQLYLTILVAALVGKLLTSWSAEDGRDG